MNGVDQKDWTTVGQASSYSESDLTSYLLVTINTDARVESLTVRVPTSNSPVKDLKSPFMACNDRGTTEVQGTLEVTAGDTIEPTCSLCFQFRNALEHSTVLIRFDNR